MKIINKLTAPAFASFPIAMIVSSFNQPVTDELKRGALGYLKEHGINEDDITVIDVPGAVEIPLIAKRLAMQKNVEVIIALGAVIRGETTHYDYVCDQVSAGCQRVMLDYNIPVIFGVLTTENDQQAEDRLGGKHGHKGIEAAECALSMHAILSQLD